MPYLVFIFSKSGIASPKSWIWLGSNSAWATRILVDAAGGRKASSAVGLAFGRHLKFYKFGPGKVAGPSRGISRQFQKSGSQGGGEGLLRRRPRLGPSLLDGQGRGKAQP